MKYRCPTCGSKDLWQPHTKTSFDRLLEKRGYGRFDCRNCWKRSIFRIKRHSQRPESPLPEFEDALVLEEKAAESPASTAPVAVARQVSIPRPEESTVIGASMLISGEVTSREGITVHGVLEETVTMDGYRLVIESGGNVSADVSAGSIAVCRDGTLTGQVRTPSFVVDDGANFNGKIELTAH